MAHPGSAASGSSSGGGSGFQFLNSPFGDTTFTKVFVGGLAWETQSDTMRRYFEHFGDIHEAVVITDRNTGRSKGYGFVTFRDPEAAKRACADPSPVIDGRRANCNLASLGRPRPPPLPYGLRHYGPEYIYPQGVYNPYASQQYLQIYGVPGTINSPVYPYGQLRQPLHSAQGYTALHGYAMPGHHLVQFSVVAAPVPAQPQFIVPAHSPEFTQGSGSDQTAGYPWIAAGLRAAALLLEWQASNLALQVVIFAF
ncbi:hypothetical protein Syun_005670 [Stephania yunnanensis]|uniref:RRM domain-containing protein n=1 Tax=Stephania yunnanensis TaxID=152371 RepID=A0AAP0Q2H4_9MAGN